MQIKYYTDIFIKYLYMLINFYTVFICIIVYGQIKKMTTYLSGHFDCCDVEKPNGLDAIYFICFNQTLADNHHAPL